MGFSLGSNTINDVKLGSSQVSELYLGSTKFWPEVFLYNIFIEGVSYSQAILESRLTGLTITAFDNSGDNTQIFTTTDYTINSNAFTFTDITSYVDDGKCVGVGSSAFSLCSSLTNISLPNVTTWGIDVFNGVANNGTITIKAGQETNANITYLVGKGWTVITV